MLKIGFGVIVFNGNYVLKEAIESVYPFATQILIAEGPVKFWQEQGYTTSTDGTNEVLASIYDPDKKIKIVHGQFNEKDDQCNAYMQHRRDDLDYIWNLDSDEIFKPGDIELVMRLLEEEQYTSVGFKSVSFFGGFARHIGGFEENAEFIRIRKVWPGSYWQTHRPPTIAHTISNPWPNKHLDFNYLNDEWGVRMYHYSYVWPEQVAQKVKYYKAAVSKQNCINHYFDRVWLPWVLGSDRVKMAIEDEFNGVHEWRPEIRGEARTKLFAGSHPYIIGNRMHELVAKFNTQLDKYV